MHRMLITDSTNGLKYEVRYEMEGSGSDMSVGPMYETDDPLTVTNLAVWHEEYGPVVLDRHDRRQMILFICENHEEDDRDNGFLYNPLED